VVPLNSGYGDKNMANERIKGTDTMQDIIVNMSDGNPGAVTVMIQMIKTAPTIDPQSAPGPLGPLLVLDTLNIWGARIWMLYKDVCKEDISKAIGILRAWQLGIISDSVLNHAIDSDGDGLDVDASLKKVCERLPDFKLLVEA
jgi:hypothetical protein